MSTTAAITAYSGFTSGLRITAAQLKSILILTNGYDTNRYYDILTQTGGTIGMSAPAAPTSATNGAGNVTGAVQHRVRWYDSTTGTFSVASDPVSITGASNTIRVTQPASPPARADYWIVERTLAGGRVYYPVNYSSASPNGTAIATTTYDDNVSDSTLRQRTALTNRQGQPSGPFRFCFTHKGRVWLVGSQPYTCTGTVTSGSATVSGTGFTSNLIGRYLTVANSTTGKSYKVTAVGGASSLTIASNAAAGDAVTNGTIIFSGPRNKIAWSEPNEPEHYGTVEVVGTSNEITIGDANEVFTAACGVGSQGILISSETCLYTLSFSNNPDPIRGDGRVVRMATRHHACGPLAMRFIEGYVYGIDGNGIWRMRPEGSPEKISDPIHYDFKRNYVYNCKNDNWHIQYDHHKGWVKFYLCENTDTYPKIAFCWDVRREKWVSKRRYHNFVTCGTEIEDKRANLRTGLWLGPASSSAATYPWFVGDDMFFTNMVPSATTPKNGSVATGSTTQVINVTGATFPTSDYGLQGVPLTVVQTSTGTAETKEILSNTVDTLTTSDQFSFTPGTSDTYILGGVKALVLTGDLDAGMPNRKKRWLSAYVTMKYKSAASTLKMRCYYDQSGTSDSDENFTRSNEDGVTVTASSPDKVGDPTTNKYTYEFPLNGKYAHCLRLALYSTSASEPWEVPEIKVVYEVDDAIVPRQK